MIQHSNFRRDWALFANRNFQILLAGASMTGGMAPVIFMVQILWVLDQAPEGWEIAAVGAVGTMRGIGAIGIGLYAGAFADRFDRRRLIIVTQVSSFLFAIGCASITVWLDGSALGLGLFFLLTMGTSAIEPVDLQTRNTIAAEILGKATSRGISALNFAWQPIALLTLLFSAEIILGLGYFGTFILIAGFGLLNAFLAVIMRYKTYFDDQVQRVAFGVKDTAVVAVRDVIDGIRVARRDQILFWSIALLVLSQIFVFPTVTHLGANWIEEVLNEPAELWGRLNWPWLLSGAVVSFFLMSLPNLHHQARIVLIGASLFPIATLIFSLPQTLTAVFIASFGFGASQSSTLIANASLVQERVPNEMRGRLMSIVQLSRGTAGLFTLPIALVAEFVPLSILIPVIAFSTLAIVVSIGIKYPRLWTEKTKNSNSQLLE